LERLRRPDFGTTSADRVPGNFHGVLANAIDGNAAVFQDCSSIYAPNREGNTFQRENLNGLYL
jgi:hypothetical protein